MLDICIPDVPDKGLTEEQFEERTSIEAFRYDGEVIGDLIDLTIKQLEKHKDGHPEQILDVFNNAYEICWRITDNKEEYLSVLNEFKKKRLKVTVRGYAYMVAWALLSLHKIMLNIDLPILGEICHRAAKAVSGREAYSHFLNESCLIERIRFRNPLPITELQEEKESMTDRLQTQILASLDEMRKLENENKRLHLLLKTIKNENLAEQERLNRQIEELRNDNIRLKKELEGKMALQPDTKKKTENNPRLTRATFKYRHLRAEPHRIGTLYQALIGHKMIDQGTRPEDFYDLFEGKENDVKIKWTGSLQHLWYLFELITSRKYVTLPSKETKWVIVQSHFVDGNSRMFRGFNKQHKPKKDLQSIELLANILDVSKPYNNLHEQIETDE